MMLDRPRMSSYCKQLLQLQYVEPNLYHQGLASSRKGRVVTGDDH